MISERTESFVRTAHASIIHYKWKEKWRRERAVGYCRLSRPDGRIDCRDGYPVFDMGALQVWLNITEHTQPRKKMFSYLGYQKHANLDRCEVPVLICLLLGKFRK